MISGWTSPSKSTRFARTSPKRACKVLPGKDLIALLSPRSLDRGPVEASGRVGVVNQLRESPRSLDRGPVEAG